MGRGFNWKSGGIGRLLEETFWEKGGSFGDEDGDRVGEMKENGQFSGGNGEGLVLMVDRGFSEKWGVFG